MVDRTSDAAGLRLTSETRMERSSGHVRTRAFWSGPAAPALVGQTRHAVAGVAAGGGVTGARLDDIRICVSEAVSNAVMHAFRGDQATGTISVSAQLSPEAFTVVVKDDGIGFAPRSDSPGLGMGLAMIATLADTMSITTAAGGGTEVMVTFDLARSPAA